MNKKYLIPLIVSISVIIGIIVGAFITSRFSVNKLNIINATSNKLNDLLHIVEEQYVDTINISNVVEKAMPKILTELDPHSNYIPAKDAQATNDDLRGSFSGVGVQFTIKNDTVHITNIIKGGPSERTGILPGDRIVSIDDSAYVGKIVTNDETMRRLKGKKGTLVKVGVVRHGEKEPLYFSIERGDIPVKSIDATYMLNDKLGYVKINKFSETTYPELLVSLAMLGQFGFEGLVIDLRGNTGGYFSSAIQIVNEFLSANQLIVYTEGRAYKKEDYYSDGRGSYQNLPLIILTDELSASSSEILAGAIQDNDRGIIIGRRSFGKGLVQQPINFNDGSLVHLTIARYHTPSGRCIQKPYTKGDDKNYDMDILSRYEHGEFFNADSIRQTGPTYHTLLGRTVYGGGGVMPDYFVPEDTTDITSYYSEIMTKGYVVQFCFDYTDANRQKLQSFENSDELLKYLKSENVVEKFIKYCDKKGVKRRNKLIWKSQKLIEQSVYGAIIYNIFDMADYVEFINRNDPTVIKAIELFNQGKTFPKP